jgi:hypothetical protein
MSHNTDTILPTSHDKFSIKTYFPIIQNKKPRVNTRWN